MKKFIGFLQDLLLLAAFATICYGVFMIYKPAGYIAVGLSFGAILYFWVGGKNGKK